MVPWQPRLRTDDDRGFTFIELLIVIALLGVLSAIVVSQFSQYRKHSYDALAQHDLGNLRVGQEALYANTLAYVACANSGCVGTVPGFRLSSTVAILATAMNGTEPSYTVTAHSTAGTGTVYSYDSASGT